MRETRFPVFWADTWVVKWGLAFTTTHTLGRLPHACTAWVTISWGLVWVQHILQAHLAKCSIRLQNFCMHYAICYCGPKLLACVGSSICLALSIRSNTGETGPRYQWKWSTNYTVANEMNFMGINLKRLCTVSLIRFTLIFSILWFNYRNTERRRKSEKYLLGISKFPSLQFIT